MDSGDAETSPDIARLRERLFIDPRNVAAMRDLARLLECAGDLPGAVDLRQRALRVDPYDLDSILELGRLWHELADPARAESWYRRALALDPDSDEAAAGLTALAQADSLSSAYIRTLFDQYADRFDRELVGALGYRAPELAASLLTRAGLAPGAADILDLGCGTGLSGLALKPLARSLDGVDLSPGMIGKARERNIYRNLAVDEATAFLTASADSWDVIAAVDMLNYIGDLTQIFCAAAARLRAGGLLVGTVEKREEGGVVLTDKRRHRHGLDALSAALATAGLRSVEFVADALRTEGGAPVDGIIFAAQRNHHLPNGIAGATLTAST
jgi:predicted TPR repeat methyltransferase